MPRYQVISLGQRGLQSYHIDLSPYKRIHNVQDKMNATMSNDDGAPWMYVTTNPRSAQMEQNKPNIKRCVADDALTHRLTLSPAQNTNPMQHRQGNRH